MTVAQNVNYLCLLLINVSRTHWISPLSFSSLHFSWTFPLPPTPYFHFPTSHLSSHAVCTCLQSTAYAPLTGSTPACPPANGLSCSFHEAFSDHLQPFRRPVSHPLALQCCNILHVWFRMLGTLLRVTFNSRLKFLRAGTMPVLFWAVSPLPGTPERLNIFKMP